jgi:hypothetical protein
MTGKIDWQAFMNQANQADPRTHPMGYFCGDQSAKVFLWFKDTNELTDALLYGEPAIYDFADNPQELSDYQNKITPILEGIRRDGLNEDRMQQLNDLTQGTYTVEWWGSFETLTSAQGEFAADLINEFRDLDSDTTPAPISPSELDEFIEFISTYGA